MFEGKLVLTERRLESKADRFFWIFKPSECIQGEPFDLYLTFRNDSDQRFEGGTCRFHISNKLRYDFTVDLPAIEPHQTKTVTVPNITLAETGFVAFTSFEVRTEDGKIVPCLDAKDKIMGSSLAYPFLLATREEMYQKYAVIVALCFSVLATILTIVNVLVSIFR